MVAGRGRGIVVTLAVLGAGCGGTRGAPSPVATGPALLVVTAVASKEPTPATSAARGGEPWPRRLRMTAQNPWSPDGRRLALSWGIVDLVTRETTPFDCSAPRWLSARFAVCDDHGLALDMETGTTRTLPCAGALVWGEHFGACVKDGVTIIDLASDASSSVPFRATVEFAPDGLAEVWDGTTGGIQLWDVRASAPVGDVFGRPAIGRRRTTRDGRWSFWIGFLDGTSHLLDRRTGAATELANDGGTTRARGLDFAWFNHAEDRVAMPVEQGGVRVVDVATQKELFVATSARCPAPFHVAWSADDRLVATSGSDRTVCVFDVARQTLATSFTVRPLEDRTDLIDTPDTQWPDRGEVVLLAFTPDGAAVIAGQSPTQGSRDCAEGGLYRTSSGEALGDLGRICGNGTATPLGEWLVHGPSGWTLITKDVRRVRVGPAGAAASPDGHLFVSRATVGAVEGAKRPSLDQVDRATLLSFDPTGTKILGTVDEAPRVWDVATGQVIASFP